MANGKVQRKRISLTSRLRRALIPSKVATAFKLADDIISEDDHVPKAQADVSDVPEPTLTPLPLNRSIGDLSSHKGDSTIDARSLSGNRIRRSQPFWQLKEQSDRSGSKPYSPDIISPRHWGSPGDLRNAESPLVNGTDGAARAAGGASSELEEGGGNEAASGVKECANTVLEPPTLALSNSASRSVAALEVENQPSDRAQG
eukprot:1351653-Pleurochrysis_carterae.AAC.1